MNRHTEHLFCFGLMPCVTRGRALAGKLAVAMAALLAAGESLEAEVHLVPADRDAIQAAIDAAVPGDRIVVAPGECPVSKIHVERSRFEESTSFKAGGAIFAEGKCDLTIIDCTFERSLANSAGGGLCLHNDTTARVRNCVFSKSYAPGGAAIMTVGTPLVIVENTVILGSSLGAIHDEGGGRFEIRNSIIWDTVFWGGFNTPIVLLSPVDALIEHSIIEGPTVDVSDAVHLLRHLFLGGPELPGPHRECGVDPTADGLRCAAPPQCNP